MENNLKSSLALLLMVFGAIFASLSVFTSFVSGALCDSSAVAFYSVDSVNSDTNFNVTLRLFRNGKYDNVTLVPVIGRSDDSSGFLPLSGNGAADRFLVNYSIGDTANSSRNIVAVLENSTSNCTLNLAVGVYKNDLDSPVIETMSPSNGSNQTVQAITLDITTSELSMCRFSETSGFDYDTQGTDMNTTDGLNHAADFTVPYNDELNYTYYFQCKDYVLSPAPHYSSYNYTKITVHLSHPALLGNIVVSDTVNNVTTAQSFTISFNTTESAICGFTNGTTFDSAFVSSHSVLISESSDGSNTYQFNCTDRYGLVSNTSINKTVLIDSVVPAISSVKPQLNSTVSDTELNVTANKVVVSCDYSDDNFTWTSMTLVNTTFANVTETLADGTYTYYFRCTDSADRVSAVVNTTFVVDTTAPMITLNAPLVHYVESTPVVLNVSTNEDATCMFDNGTAFTKSGLNFNYTVTGATENVNNSYIVECTDVYGFTNSTTIWFALDALKPDLVITQIENVTQSLYGQNYSVNVTVSNYGTDDAAVSFNVEVTLNGTSVNRTVSSLTFGSSAELNYSFNINYIAVKNMTMKIYSVGINESNSSNNNNWTMVTPLYADFTLGGFNTNITQEANETAKFNITVSNIGNMRVNDVNVSMYVESVLIDSVLKNLSGGYSENISFDWYAATQGTYNVTFVVDPADAVLEWNESNNRYENSSYSVDYMGPKVSVVDYYVSGTAWEDEAVTFVLNLTNVGDRDGNVSVELYFNGSSVNSTYVVVPQFANASVVFTYVPANAGTVNYAFDVNGSMTADKQVTVYHRFIDVNATGLNRSRTTVYDNNFVQFNTTVYNNGNQSHSVNVTLYDGGVVKNSTIVTVLNGTSMVVGLNYTIVAGDHNITMNASIAANDTYVGRDENVLNNFVYDASVSDIYSYALSSVIASSTRALGFNATTVTGAETFRVYLPIQNKGMTNDYSDLRITLSVTNGNVVTAETVSHDILAGQDALYTWDVQASSPGSVDVTAIVEGDNVIIGTETVTIN